MLGNEIFIEFILGNIVPRLDIKGRTERKLARHACERHLQARLGIEDYAQLFKVSKDNRKLNCITKDSRSLVLLLNDTRKLALIKKVTLKLFYIAMDLESSNGYQMTLTCWLGY